MSIATQFSFKDNDHLKISSPILVEIGKKFELESNGKSTKIDLPDKSTCVRLDHPSKVDADGARRTNNPFGGADLTDLQYPDTNERRTCCGTGCWLEFNNIMIPKEKSLHFWYRFFRFGNPQSGNNAIALLLAYPGNDTWSAPTKKFLICDDDRLEKQLQRQ